jgi:ribulose kinase
MNNQVFLGIDVGSASVRAGLFDRKGRRLAFAVRPIAQFHTGSLQVEQSSSDIWAQTCAATQEALRMADIDPKRIAAIGIDATCSLVMVGQDAQPISVAESGDPTHDIIMWMDHRAGAQAAQINASGDRALAYVGGEVSVEMELPKVLWLKQHFPQRYAASWRFFDLADYLVWRASGADIASVWTLTCKW